MTEDPEQSAPAGTAGPPSGGPATGRWIPSWFLILPFYLFIAALIPAAEPIGFLQPGHWVLIVSPLLQMGLLVICARTLLTRDGLRLGEVVGRAEKKGLFVGTLVGFVLWLTMQAVSAGLSEAFGDLAPNAGWDGLADSLDGTSLDLTLLFLGFGILGPGIEEFIFRSYAFSSLSKTWGDSPSRQGLYLILTSATFAAIHLPGHPAFYLYFLTAGLGLGLLYLRTRSFFTCWTAHIIINIAGMAANLNQALSAPSPM